MSFIHSPEAIYKIEKMLRKIDIRSAANQERPAERNDGLLMRKFETIVFERYCFS